MKHKHTFQTIKSLESELGKAKIIKCTECQKEFFAICDELGTVRYILQTRETVKK